MTMMTELSSRVQEFSRLAAAIHEELESQLARLGFQTGSVPIQAPSDAAYRLEPDPASGEAALIGEWRDEGGRKSGNLVFHADGSFFVEHDVLRNHPFKPAVFVEALTAWGRGDVIKSEPRFLEWPS